MIDGWYEDKLKPLPARGEPMPQTIEACKAIMARDAVLIEEQDKKIRVLEARVVKSTYKLESCRNKLTTLRRKGGL